MGIGESGQGFSDGEIKRLIREELDGKEESKELRDRLNGIEKKLRLVGDMVCNGEGQCRLVTAEQLEKLGKQQAESAVGAIDKAYEQLDQQWSKLSPEQKKNLKVVPKGAHETMYNVIFDDGSPSRKGAIKRVLASMNAEELADVLENDPEVISTVAGALLCTSQSCKDHYNRKLDELKKRKGKNQGSSWLTKKGG